MWLGIDDTDSPRGGCTTWALTELARLAPAHGLDLIGEPRLVRLNPNVPWKTRGNAALALHLGQGHGRATTVGELGARAVVAYRRGVDAGIDAHGDFLRDAWQRLMEIAPADRGTDPAMVATDRPLPASLYWSAVRDVVRIGEVRAELARVGAAVRVRGGRRGIIGASAAIAWPGKRATWELLAYRHPERIGRPRDVDVASVLAAQARYPELFLCHDPRTRRLLVAPHTDCPILFGLRGRTPAAPREALATVVAEPRERWMLFRTNQATGDHLVPRAGAELRAYRGAIVRGTVVGTVESLPGGHVRFALRDDVGTRIGAVAFEPTKTLPAAARGLVPGDVVRAWGSVGPRRTLRLEGLELIGPARMGRFVPPSCAVCGRGTASLGTRRGWRCRSCGRRLPPEAARWSPTVRDVPSGPVHPTPSARRHLAPLP